jgi:hypothetical protein
MAVVWSYPLLPFDVSAGTPVSAAALTAATPLPAPVSPPIQLAGTQVRLDANGEFTSGSSTPTLELGFYAGAPGTAIGSEVVLCATTTLALPASATAWPFTMKYIGTIRTLATGSSANGVIHGSGWVAFAGASTGLSSAMTINPMPVTAAARTLSTLPTNGNLQFDVGVTLSATTGTPSVTITDFCVEILG